MNLMPDTVTAGGVVLIGGASRRMGTDKAHLEIDGRAMALRCADAMSESGLSPVIAVGEIHGEPALDGLPQLPDEWPGAGPLGALVSALDHMTTELVVVLSCDLLNPSAIAIRELCQSIGGHDAAIPVAEGRAQWMHGVWRRGARSRLRRRFVDGERSIRGAVGELNVLRFTVDQAVHYHDANRPSDLPKKVPRPPADPTVSSSHQSGDSMPIPQISVDELVIAMAGDAPLYDVREPNEYGSGHVEGAIAVPLGEVAESLDKFADDRRVYVICASGARSGRAVEYLRTTGIDAHNVSGGTNAWVESGRHTVSDESSS